MKEKKSGPLRAKLLCRHCRAIYDGKHWIPFEKLDTKMVDELKLNICPACHEISEHISDGILHLHGRVLKAHRREILNLLKNSGMPELPSTRD